MKKYLGFIVLALIVVLGGWWLMRSAGINDRTNGNLQDFSGKEILLENFEGKPRIINSWAVWCPFCVDELDDFALAQKELGDSVTIIAINRAEPLAVAKGFTDKIGVTNDLIFLQDPADSFYQSIGGFSMPETLFITADGVTKFHKRGPMSKDEIIERARALIN